MDTLNELRLKNKQRSVEAFGVFIEEWDATAWACAVAGEVGEMCNFIKKKKRGDDIQTKEIADEMADVIIYLDLLAQKLNINLRRAVIEKFNSKSFDKGVSIFLTE